MEKDLVVQEEQGLEKTVGTTDRLLQMANMAEQRIEAIKKIKIVALALTNVNDWVDQQGKPYLQASGSEKIAGAFDISWEFLTLEPAYEEDPEGHYTYTYHGKFSMAGRTIHVDGSRSSNDGFFRQYNYEEGKPRKEKPVQERTNKRDVKMAALTNLLGNGITRLLGIRNLTYDDLEKFAGITKDMLGKVEYKSKKQSDEKLELTEEQTKLWQTLVQYCGADKQKVAQELKTLTTWTVSKGKDKGKKVEGKASIYDVSDAQAKTVRHQIEKELGKSPSSDILKDKCGTCRDRTDCESIGKTMGMREACDAHVPIENTKPEVC